MRGLLLALPGLVLLTACGGAQPPRTLPEPEALVRRLPNDPDLAGRLGLGAREDRPRTASVLHETASLALIEARTDDDGLYLVVLDRTGDGWSVAGSVLAARSGVERVRLVHATAEDATEIAVEGGAVGLWHLAPDPPRPGLRQILSSEGPGELVVEETGRYPRAIRVGESRFTGGVDGYAAEPRADPEPQPQPEPE